MRVLLSGLKADKRGAWRSLVSLLVLFFFTTQTFLVQTHLHDLPKSFAAATAPQASTPHQTKAPVDADKCLLCQEYTHGGVFLLPAAIAALPPTAALSLLPLALSRPALERPVSHSWISRAPPHHV